MTYGLFDHPPFQTLLAREDLTALFTPDADIQAMLRFETALAEAQAEAGLIPAVAAAAIADVTKTFKADEKKLAAGVARDGLAVPVLIKHLRDKLDKAYRAHLHYGATSQDVIDTGLMLRLKTAFALFARDLDSVVTKLDTHAASAGNRPLMAKTRMQHALNIRLTDRIGIWKTPLEQHRSALEDLRDHIFAVQLAGPVGTLDKLGDKGTEIRRRVAEKLGLADPRGSWHTDRTRIADIANWLSKVNGSLGKIGQDVALMAQNGIGEAVIEGGGLSSSMPHKMNPVLAELLVTLARYNAGQLGVIHQVLVHENERSGSAWTLEWLVLPEMVAATGASLKLGRDMLDTLTFPES
jgi:3-carboxy-cis,cis-muconate cycloisomerase